MIGATSPTSPVCVDVRPPSGSLVRHEHRERAARLWLVLLCLAVDSALVAVSAPSVFPLSVAVLCGLVVAPSLSTLARVYAGYVLLGLVIAPRLNSLDSGQKVTDVLAAFWVLAVCAAGTLAAGNGRLRRLGGLRVQARQRLTPAILLSLLAIFTSALLIARGTYGVTGQYASGQSSGGYLGLLAQFGPPSAAGAFIVERSSPERSRRRIVLTGTLVGAQAVMLAFSGFRGAAPLYVLAVALCLLDRPLHDASRAVGRRMVASVVMISFLIVLYIIGAVVRQSAAEAAGMGPGNSLTLSAIVPTVARRFDEAPMLRQAELFKDSQAAKDAVAVGKQFAVLVPRFLYPGKPIVDYGKQVSIYFFNAPPSTRNSSTITTLGDALVNFGLPFGLVVVGLYVLCLDAIFRRMRAVGTVTSLAVRVAVTVAALNLEAAPVLNLIGIVRLVLALVAAHWALGWLTNPARLRHAPVVRSRRPALARADIGS